MSSAIEDSQLIDELIQLSKKSPKLVKATESAVPGCEDVIVRSWKMNEFKYYDVPSPFPTLARGLFTTDVKGEVGVKHRIVVRGYDKFFNIGEVPWNTWPALKELTTAPYVLSLKSNGCIIFIAAITPTKLIVTSKHSVGIGGEDVSHAARGRSWLNRYLEQKGRSEADLAAVLWENRWTAVAELCDDSFEEHVLPYAPEKTGLHLHGLNVCSKAFQTLPHSDVDAFAEEWGFIRTASTTLNTIEEVQAFTDDVGKTGKWNGEAVEGFVVRTHISRHRKDTPYAVGSSFFFKVKFDEPYMMYRDWREVTKSLLAVHAKGAKMSPGALPKSKMKREETQVYVSWVIQDIQRHPELYAEYPKNKGIIATRERFLKYLEEGGGFGVLPSGEGSSKRDFGKTIIVPVAIPGCGKTSVSLALAHLFGWGHTQSDNVQSKKPGPVFIKNVVNLLKDHDVVIADKNNHLKQHRDALRLAVQYESPPVRLLALNWGVFSKPPALVHRICSDRIWKRGERHQTLRPDVETGKRSHEEVVWMFLNTAEELTPDEVDAVVDMEIEDDVDPAVIAASEGSEGLERQVRRAAEGVCEVLGLEVPSDEKIKESVAHVREYEESIATTSPGVATEKKQNKKMQKELGARKGGAGEGRQKKGAAARYYGILPEVDLMQLVDSTLSTAEMDAETRESLDSFWTQVKEANSVTKRPHITIVHKNELRGGGENKTTQELWDQCAIMHDAEGAPLYEGRIGRLMWNNRVMALTVEDIGVQGAGQSTDVDEDLVRELDQVSVSSHAGPSKTAFRTAQSVLENLGESRRSRLHVTVATSDRNVQPVEAKDMVESFRDAWRQGEGEGVVVQQTAEGKVYSVHLGGIPVKGLLKGMIG